MKRVLVIGDVMVDRYVHVTATRPAQEAPVMVWDVERVERRFGGAANVALNVKSLMGDGVDVSLTGICSEDDRFALQELDLDVHMCVSATSGSMEKVRYVNDGVILVRADNFRAFDRWDAQDVLYELADDALAFDAVIVSDYDKGTVTAAHVDKLAKIPLRVVDSKRRDLEMFKGFDLLKVNAAEHAQQASRAIPVESLFGHVVVTRGAKGADLRTHDRQMSDVLATNTRARWSLRADGPMNVVHFETFPVEPVYPVDVTGCGDTHTAAMTVELLRSDDVREAVRFGNECAREAVATFGTAVVAPPEKGTS